MVKFALKLAIHGQRLDVTWSDIEGVARHAEEAGFDGLYVIDHLMLPGSRLQGYTEADPEHPYFMDAWTSLAAIAAVTERVRVGPQVTPIGLRHPAFVAKWAMTVDQVSNGRLLLQVGAGHQEVEYESFGFPYPALQERVERLSEGIDVIRQLWSSTGPANYQGKHYVLDEVPFWPKPVQDSPEIWLGGSSKRVRQLVAEKCDGWTPAAPQGGGLDPEFFRESLEAIRDDAAERGRSITGAGMFYTAVDDDRDVVERRLRVLRRREDWAQWELEQFRRTGIALAGTPDDIIEAVERYEDAGVEHFTVGFVPVDDIAATHEGIDYYRERIIPHFALKG